MVTPCGFIIIFWELNIQRCFKQMCGLIRFVQTLAAFSLPNNISPPPIFCISSYPALLLDPSSLVTLAISFVLPNPSLSPSFLQLSTIYFPLSAFPSFSSSLPAPLSFPPSRKQFLCHYLRGARSRSSMLPQSVCK